MCTSVQRYLHVLLFAAACAAASVVWSDGDTALVDPTGLVAVVGSLQGFEEGNE